MSASFCFFSFSLHSVYIKRYLQLSLKLTFLGWRLADDQRGCHRIHHRHHVEIPTRSQEMLDQSQLAEHVTTDRSVSSDITEPETAVNGKKRRANPGIVATITILFDTLLSKVQPKYFSPLKSVLN